MYDNLPLLIFSFLFSVIFVVVVVCVKMFLYKILAKKKTRTPTSTQSLSTTSTQNNRIRTARDLLPSDHQIIFERITHRPLRIIPRSTTAIVPTQIVQEIEEQLHVDNVLNEYERRAHERREVLNRNNAFLYQPHEPSSVGEENTEQPFEIFLIAPREPLETLETFENDFSNFNPAPLYVFQDDELPSYEAATATK